MKHAARILPVLMLLIGVVLASAATRPNVIVVLADDSGFSDLGCYGSEIQTPNLDALGTNGLRFAQFYNTARCSPTRASLMTGLYSWQAGIGHLVEDNEESGYTPALNRKCVTVAEVLKAAGYGTYMAGKWHIGGEATNQFPVFRGFDHWFGVLVNGSSTIPGGDGYYGANYWLDTAYTNAGSGPFTSDRYTDFALRFLSDHIAQTNAPFFLYLAFNAPHYPLTVPPEGLTKYRNTFTNGWEEHRQQRYARQLALGIVKTNWSLSVPEHSYVWTNLTAGERDTNDLAMATHAAMVENIDKNVGRVVDFLKANSLFTNTVVIFLSDNGASNEGGNASMSDATHLSTVGANWANTPWRLYKMFVREGGISTPLVISWPAGITQPAIRWQPGHLIDIMPTICEITGASYPTNFHGNPILPLEGQSLVPAFNSTNVIPRTLFFEHQGNRAYRSNDWKAVAIGRTTYSWELFNLAADRSETTNLAALYPDIVAGLSNAWEKTAWRVGDLPAPSGNSYVKMRTWVTVDDFAGGDGDGQPEPGETVKLYLETIKRGTGGNTGLSGVLAAVDTNVTVLVSNSAFSSFGSGTGTNSTAFQIRIASNAPVNQSQLFSLQINSGVTPQWADEFALVVRSYSRVSGQVSETATGKALRNATVAGGMIVSAKSDAFGNYSMLLEPGSYALAASLAGYAPTQREETIVSDASAEHFALVWTNTGLGLRVDRPFPQPVVVPTNVNLLLRSTVLNGPASVAWTTVNGPVAAQFENSGAADTAVVFPQAGQYDLRAVANNGLQQTTQAVTVLVIPPVLPDPGTNQLVCWLKFDEASGTTNALDSAKTNNSLLINMDAASVWTNGVRNGCIQFDGSNDVVNIPDSVDVNTGTNKTRTVSLWFWATDPSSTTKQVILDEGGTTRGMNVYLLSGQLYAGAWNNDGTQSGWTGTWISTSNILAQHWHHVAITINGGPVISNNALIAYLDGLEIGRGPGSQLWPRVSDNGVGARYDATRFHDGNVSGTGNYFDGRVDDLRIYERVLSPLEILGLVGVGNYSYGVAVDAGTNRSPTTGLQAALYPQAQIFGTGQGAFASEWLVRQGPAGVTFSAPRADGIPIVAEFGAPGDYLLRLIADTGDVASYDDVSLTNVHTLTFNEWMAGYPLLTGGQTATNADPDLDGRENRMEYELGTPPDCAGCSSASTHPSMALTGNPVSAVQLRVPLRRGALGRGLVLQVERRANLTSGSWTNCAFSLNSVTDMADYEFQTVTLDLQIAPAELALPADYYRVVYSAGP